MPIYEYQCQQCQHKLEVMQRISDAPLLTCPSCSEDAMKKLVSAVGFQLKGTGWYETDFKTKPKPKTDGDSAASKDSAADSGKTEGKSEGKSEGRSEGRSESKPETKSETKATPAATGTND